MYKTVRHGENSLQYTILPQTEEVLSNSGLKGKGRDYSPSIHLRRTRRKSTVKYVILVLFGIIVALALASVPLYVMNGALYARRNLQEHREGDDFISTASLITSGREIAKSKKKDLKILPASLSTFKSDVDTSIASTFSTPFTITSTLKYDKTTTSPWSMPGLRYWKSTTSSTPPPIAITSAHSEIPLLGAASSQYKVNTPSYNNFGSKKPWETDMLINPTKSPEKATIRNLFRHLAYTGSPPMPFQNVISTENSAPFHDVLITSKPPTIKNPVITSSYSSTTSMSFIDLKNDILSDDEEFKSSLKLDEVFSIQSQKPDYSSPNSESEDVIVSKTNDAAWYGARWPFVDTSSYFQWTVRCSVYILIILK